LRRQSRRGDGDRRSSEFWFSEAICKRKFAKRYRRVPLKYRTGEVVMRGDRVLLSGEVGVVEYIADETINDPMSRWLLEENRGGVMISQLRSLGRVFTSPEEDSDVEFLSRGDYEAAEESGQPGTPPRTSE
jgi:hypothetical protein